MVINNGQVIVVLDMGANTITAAAIHIISIEDGRIDILAIEKQKFSITINNDIIEEIKKVFLPLVDKLETKTSRTIQHISLSFDRDFALSIFNSVEVNFHHTTSLKKYHLNKLLNICRNNCEDLYPNHKIIEICENYFIMDGSIKTSNELINTPIRSIYAHYHVFMLHNIIYEQINEYMTANKMQVINVLPSSYVRSIAALTPAEKDGRTLFIDIGAAKTTIIMYKDGYPEFIEYIPLGGFHVTKDIASILSISFENAERIKLMANLIDQRGENFIEISDNADLNKKNHITADEIRSIGAARIKEILTLSHQIVYNKLYITNEEKISSIIISGGVAKSYHITDICYGVYKIKSRIDDQDVEGGLTFSDHSHLLRENRLDYNILLGHIIYIIKKKKFLEMKKTSNYLANLAQKITCFLEEIFY